ncbi:hypothetical protein [Streptomyces sp. NPDC046385]|uniref:hypothetical protein n=1 Tax=Streptomyces sp. NPDC046385 TaxID=3154918 RepID=UPI0033C7A714
MQGTHEPELPDPVPATQDPVTPDLPARGPEAPGIRIGAGERPRTGDADEGDEPQKDAGGRDEDRPAAGPGTPAPQEQPG